MAQLEYISILPTGKFTAFIESEEITLACPLLEEMRKTLFTSPLYYLGLYQIGNVYARVSEVLQQIHKARETIIDGGREYYISNYIKIAGLIDDFTKFVLAEMAKITPPTTIDINLEDMDTSNRKRREIGRNRNNLAMKLRLRILNDSHRVKRTLSQQQTIISTIIALNNPNLNRREQESRVRLIQEKLVDLRNEANNSEQLILLFNTFLTQVAGLTPENADLIIRKSAHKSALKIEEDFLDKVSQWNVHKIPIPRPAHPYLRNRDIDGKGGWTGTGPNHVQIRPPKPPGDQEPEKIVPTGTGPQGVVPTGTGPQGVVSTGTGLPGPNAIVPTETGSQTKTTGKREREDEVDEDEPPRPPPLKKKTGTSGTGSGRNLQSGTGGSQNPPPPPGGPISGGSDSSSDPNLLKTPTHDPSQGSMVKEPGAPTKVTGGDDDKEFEDVNIDDDNFQDFDLENASIVVQDDEDGDANRQTFLQQVSNVGNYIGSLFTGSNEQQVSEPKENEIEDEYPEEKDYEIEDEVEMEDEKDKNEDTLMEEEIKNEDTLMEEEINESDELTDNSDSEIKGGVTDNSDGENKRESQAQIGDQTDINAKESEDPSSQVKGSGQPPQIVINDDQTKVDTSNKKPGSNNQRKSDLNEKFDNVVPNLDRDPHRKKTGTDPKKSGVGSTAQGESTGLPGGPGKAGPIPGGSSVPVSGGINLDPFSEELEGNQIPAYTNWNQGMDSIKKYIQKQFQTMDKTMHTRYTSLENKFRSFRTREQRHQQTEQYKENKPKINKELKVSLELLFNNKLSELLKDNEISFHKISISLSRPENLKDTVAGLKNNINVLIDTNKVLPFELPFSKVFAHILSLSQNILNLYQHIHQHQSFIYLLEGNKFPGKTDADYDVFLGSTNVIKIFTNTQEVAQYEAIPFCLKVEPSYCVQTVLGSNIYRGFPPIERCQDAIKNIDKEGKMKFSCNTMLPPSECVKDRRSLILERCETQYASYRPINVVYLNLIYTCTPQRDCHFEQYNNDNSAVKPVVNIVLSQEFNEHFKSDFYSFKIQAQSFLTQYGLDITIVGASLATMGLFSLAVYRLVKNIRDKREMRINQVEMVPLRPGRNRHRSQGPRGRNVRFAQQRNVYSPNRSNQNFHFRQQRMRNQHRLLQRQLESLDA